MVERQLRRRGIGDERVLAAMAEVPREKFVPDELRSHAYRDVEVRVGDGRLGAPDGAPFDGISVTATASHAPPEPLVEQLRPGASLVYPVRRGGHELLMRLRDGREQPVVPVRFVPLLEGTGDAD
jgi:protein-L-isoaspartate(D-aspartate) O-methyltransferase